MRKIILALMLIPNLLLSQVDEEVKTDITILQSEIRDVKKLKSEIEDINLRLDRFRHQHFVGVGLTAAGFVVSTVGTTLLLDGRDTGRNIVIGGSVIGLVGIITSITSHSKLKRKALK